MSPMRVSILEVTIAFSLVAALIAILYYSQGYRDTTNSGDFFFIDQKEEPYGKQRRTSDLAGLF